MYFLFYFFLANLNCTEMKKSEFEIKQTIEGGIDSKPLSELDSHDLVVPTLLLNHYADMAGAFDDSDLASQCACMLPAVLITIGPAFWPLLRHTYYVLASHRSVCLINKYVFNYLILVIIFNYKVESKTKGCILYT